MFNARAQFNFLTLRSSKIWMRFIKQIVLHDSVDLLVSWQLTVALLFSVSSGDVLRTECPGVEPVPDDGLPLLLPGDLPPGVQLEPGQHRVRRQYWHPGPGRQGELFSLHIMMFISLSSVLLSFMGPIYCTFPIRFLATNSLQWLYYAEHCTQREGIFHEFVRTNSKYFFYISKLFNCSSSSLLEPKI